jgi:hypothetical protein
MKKTDRLPETGILYVLIGFSACIIFPECSPFSNRPFTPLSELAVSSKLNQFDVKCIADYLDDEELWRLSMTHATANPATGKNHERLEFLGDRFLELVRWQQARKELMLLRS